MSFGPRAADVVKEDGGPRNPLRGMFPQDAPVPTMEKAMAPLAASHPGLQGLVATANDQVDFKQLTKKYPRLTHDECAAVVFYSIEATPRDESPYFAVNAALRARDRSAVAPWKDYIWLLLNALRKLPATDATSVYRGCQGTPAEMNLRLEPGGRLVWSGFSSTAKNVALMNEFLGESGDRVMFDIQLTEASGRDISDFSMFPHEVEVLLPPNVKLEFVGNFNAGNRLTMVQLRQLPSIDPLIEFGAPAGAQQQPSTPAASGGGGGAAVSPSSFQPQVRPQVMVREMEAEAAKARAEAETAKAEAETVKARAQAETAKAEAEVAKAKANTEAAAERRRRAEAGDKASAARAESRAKSRAECRKSCGTCLSEVAGYAGAALRCGGKAPLCMAEQLASWLASDAPRGVGISLNLLYLFIPNPGCQVWCPASDDPCCGRGSDDRDSFAKSTLMPLMLGVVHKRQGQRSNEFRATKTHACDDNMGQTVTGAQVNCGSCFLGTDATQNNEARPGQGHACIIAGGVHLILKSPFHGWACLKGELFPYSKCGE